MRDLTKMLVEKCRTISTIHTGIESYTRAYALALDIEKFCPEDSDVFSLNFSYQVTLSCIVKGQDHTLWHRLYRELRGRGFKRSSVSNIQQAAYLRYILTHKDIPTDVVLEVTFPECTLEKVGEEPQPPKPIYRIVCGGEATPIQQPDDDIVPEAPSTPEKEFDDDIPF